MRTIRADRPYVWRACRVAVAESHGDRGTPRSLHSERSADIRATLPACRDGRYAIHSAGTRGLPFAVWRRIICWHRPSSAALPDPCATRDRSQSSSSRPRWRMRASLSCGCCRTQGTPRRSSERHLPDAAAHPRGTPWIVCEGANIPESIQEGQGSVEPSLSRRCQWLVWPRIRRATPSSSSCPTVSNHGVTPFDRPRESFVGRHL